MSDITRVIKEGEFADYPQQPHGGKLVDAVLKDKELEDALKRVADLPAIMIDMEAVITVEMIATGVLSPNDGFMDEANYKSVLSKGRLTNGLIWRSEERRVGKESRYGGEGGRAIAVEGMGA